MGERIFDVQPMPQPMAMAMPFAYRRLQTVRANSKRYGTQIFPHTIYSLYTYSYIHLNIMCMGSATNAGCKPEMLQLQLGNGRRRLADSFVDATRSLLTRLQCVFVHRLLNSPTTWFARCVSPMHRCQRSLRLR